MATGQHGTPSFNPRHPDQNHDYSKRDSDPLWQYHRGLRGYGAGYVLDPKELAERTARWAPGAFTNRHPGYQVIHPSQHDSNHSNASLPQPEGMTATSPYVVRVRPEPGEWRRHMETVDGPLTADLHLGDNPATSMSSGAPLTIAWPRAEVFAFHGSGPGRPMHHGIFPLQALLTYAKPSDPYRIWAASVLGGNRHAIGPLVHLLRARDNPAGFWKGWADLHRRMEREQGDLRPDQVAERLRRIAAATLPESGDLETHRALAERAHDAAGREYEFDPTHTRAWNDSDRNWTPYEMLADHMEEHGLPQYAALVRSELANVLPHLVQRGRGRQRFRRPTKFVREEDLHAMLEKMHQHPEDEQHRMMVADALEEAGKPSHAEIIRSSRPAFFPPIDIYDRKGFTVLGFRADPQLDLDHWLPLGNRRGTLLTFGKKFNNHDEKNEFIKRLLREEAKPLGSVAKLISKGRKYELQRLRPGLVQLLRPFDAQVERKRGPAVGPAAESVLDLRDSFTQEVLLK